MVLFLVAVFVLMVAGIAYAVPTNTHGTWDGTNTSYNYNWPQLYSATGTMGLSPHNNYSTATNKCRECHAVHRASGSYKLTRSNTRWETCDFCHGVGAGAGTNITMGTVGTSNGHHLGVYEDRFAPDTTKTAYTDNAGAYTPPTDGFSCFDCHSIHGNPNRMVAGISDTLSTTGAANNLLLGNPNLGNERGWCAQWVDMTDWCSDCHAGNSGSVDVQRVAWDNNTNSWDTGYSHDAQTNGYTTTGAMKYTVCGSLEPDYDGYAKVIPTDGVNEGPKCRQCHTSQNDSPYSWPHSSPGYVLLPTAVNVADPHLDQVCLNCHNTLALP